MVLDFQAVYFLFDKLQYYILETAEIQVEASFLTSEGGSSKIIQPKQKLSFSQKNKKIKNQNYLFLIKPIFLNNGQPN
jgi:hypothetical protein